MHQRFAGLILFAFVCGSVVAAERGGSASLPAAEVDKIFAAWKDKPNSAGCSLGVQRDGKLIYSAGYGLANIEFGVPNSPTTVFHIASVSKQFTAFAIQLLAHEGKLSLDDDVRKYLPELADFGKTITIRHLIHHTSGLRDQWSLVTLAGWRFEDVITENDILEMVWRQRELNFDPGEEQLYSNTGYTLLAVIVKRVSGKSLHEFLAERAFEPLGMKNTRFQDDVSFVIKNRASSYGPRGNGVYRYIPLSYSNVGATSLHTTIEDLARWDEGLHTGKAGGPAVLASMLVRGKLNNGRETDYASGLVYTTHRGRKVIEHNGGDAGFRTTLTRFPDQHLSVIVLCNAAEANPSMLSRAVADLFLASELGEGEAEKEKEKPREIQLDAAAMQPFVGVYELNPSIVLRITIEDGKLMATPTGQPKVQLFASSPKEFFVTVVDATITFDDPVDGQSPALTLHQGGMNQRAPRVTYAKPTPAMLEKYAGTYYSAELDVLYHVSVKGDSLSVHYPRGDLPLSPRREHEFGAPYPILALKYDCNEDVCTSFKINGGRVRNLRFDRVRIDKVIR